MSDQGSPNSEPEGWVNRRFIGREEEIKTYTKHLLFGDESRLSMGTSRCVTLKGPPGVGKTSLALQIYRSARAAIGPASIAEFFEFKRDAITSVLDIVAGRFGVEAGDEDTTIDKIIQHLEDSGNAVLLWFDNCDYVIEGCSKLIGRLIRGCSRLYVLATCREKLGLGNYELDYSIQGFPVRQYVEIDSSQLLEPGILGAFLREDPIRLFIERAAEAGNELTRFKDPDSAARIARICYRLDGVPLFIELVAGLTELLSLQTLEQKLRSPEATVVLLNSHEEALNYLIEWSYDHLSESSQMLLRRLAVFEGGWTLSAAEAVCSDDDVLSSDAVFASTLELSKKSLISVRDVESDERYYFLEAIHAYFSTKLSSDVNANMIKNNHAKYYEEYITNQSELIRGTNEQLALQEIDKDKDNLLTALSFYIESGEVGTLFNFLEKSIWFWYYKSYNREVVALLDKNLKSILESANLNTTSSVSALIAISGFLHNIGRSREGLKPARMALTASRKIGYRFGMAWSLYRIGMVLLNLGAPLSSLWSARGSVNLYEELTKESGLLEYKTGLFMARRLKGAVMQERFLRYGEGSLADARDILEKAVSEAQRWNNGHEYGLTLRQCGELALHEGDPGGAQDRVPGGV